MMYLISFWGMLLSTAMAEEADLTTNKEPEQNPEGIQAFQQVYQVLQHPRCLNCHPSGDAPLQNDDSQPHAMNISRLSLEGGLECAACHQSQNSEAFGIAGGPPGAPNWHLPEKDMPLVFQGLRAAELCAQLKNSEENGHKTMQELLAHIAGDPLVLWGWNPGGDRSTPPLSHADFVTQFQQWMAAGAPCPSDSNTPSMPQ